MAKRKYNPYGEFVRAEYLSLKKSNPKFNKPMSAMFGNPAIREKWKSSDEETKQKFRDISVSKNEGTYVYHTSHQNKGQGFQQPDEMRNDFMASQKLFNRCEDIIHSKTYEELLEAPLYSFSCNVMCAENESEELYIPLEIAIYAYTLKNGAPKDKPVYLTFINPGEPPVGKMNEAKKHYEDTRHKVPFEPLAPFLPYARTDYREIYKEILEYVGEERILLCQHADYIQQIYGVLKWLAKKANEKPFTSTIGLIRPQTANELPAADSWRICDISEYAFQMGKRLGSPLPASVCIEMLLENMRLAYANHLNCEWHSLPQNETQWCAKSCSVRTIVNLENLFDWFKDTYSKKERATTTCH